MNPISIILSVSVLFVGISQATKDTETACAANDHACGHLENMGAIEKIYSWWEKMSPLKPLKCKDRFASIPIADEDYHPIAREFLLMECDDATPQILFGYKGFAEDDKGMLTGPGRLIRKPG